jgi:mRNA interferase RelE/StbE
MLWTLVYDPAAEKELSKLDKGIARKIRKYLDEVCELPDPADRGHPLTGPWAGFHRYRVGQIRIIAEIERQIITISVLKIDRRDSIC